MTTQVNKEFVEKTFCEVYQLMNLEQPQFFYAPDAASVYRIIKDKRVDIEESIAPELWYAHGVSLMPLQFRQLCRYLYDNMRNAKKRFLACLDDDSRYDYAELEDITQYFPTCFSHEGISQTVYYTERGIIYPRNDGTTPHGEKFEIEFSAACAWCFAFKQVIVVCEKPGTLRLTIFLG